VFLIPNLFFFSFFLPKLFTDILGAWGIKEAIETINRMQADGVIERYAIGGAVGATRFPLY
jgi:hypothetical protein